MIRTLARYRDETLIRRLVDGLHGLPRPGRKLCFMHVCGTHEHAIGQFGIRQLLPDWLQVIAGPGCPVCVCTPAEIDLGARLALERGVILATFGDMVPVPSRISLDQARAIGGDIRVVRGVADAVALARRTPGRTVVFFSIGFETTACTVAAATLAGLPENLFLLTAHRLIPPALKALLGLESLRIDGFVLPGHVLTVTGLSEYEACLHVRQIPAAVAGFEPADVLFGIYRLARLAVEGRSEIVNAYPRAVRLKGNERAREALERVFVPVDAAWRGLGSIPASGLGLRPEFRHSDAERHFGMHRDQTLADSLPGCRCAEVMVGHVTPEQCGLFGRDCTPATPRGPCMVSREGTCRARYLYREA